MRNGGGYTNLHLETVWEKTNKQTNKQTNNKHLAEQGLNMINEIQTKRRFVIHFPMLFNFYRCHKEKIPFRFSAGIFCILFFAYKCITLHLQVVLEKKSIQFFFNF